VGHSERDAGLRLGGGMLSRAGGCGESDHEDATMMFWLGLFLGVWLGWTSFFVLGIIVNTIHPQIHPPNQDNERVDPNEIALW
jgi:hypothetical protein